MFYKLVDRRRHTQPYYVVNFQDEKIASREQKTKELQEEQQRVQKTNQSLQVRFSLVSLSSIKVKNGVVWKIYSGSHWTSVLFSQSTKKHSTSFSFCIRIQTQMTHPNPHFCRKTLIYYLRIFIQVRNASVYSKHCYQHVSCTYSKFNTI